MKKLVYNEFGNLLKEVGRQNGKNLEDILALIFSEEIEYLLTNETIRKDKAGILDFLATLATYDYITSIEEVRLLLKAAKCNTALQAADIAKLGLKSKFGKLLEQHLQISNLDNAQLALLANIDQSTISRAIRGGRRLKREQIIELGKAFLRKAYPLTPPQLDELLQSVDYELLTVEEKHNIFPPIADAEVTSPAREERIPELNWQLLQASCASINQKRSDYQILTSGGAGEHQINFDAALGKIGNQFYFPRQEFLTLFQQYLAQSEQPFLVVQGKSGVGKSTFATWLIDHPQDSAASCTLVYDLKRADFLDCLTLDLLTEFKLISSSNTNDSIGSAAQRLEILTRCLRQLVPPEPSAHLIIIIDSLNEVVHYKEVAREITLIVTQLTQALDWCKVVINTVPGIWYELRPDLKIAPSKFFYGKQSHLINRTDLQYADLHNVGVELEPFSEGELTQIYEKLRSEKLLTNDLADLPPVIQQLLRLPFFLKFIIQGNLNLEILAQNPDQILNQYFDGLVRTGRLGIDDPIYLRTILIELMKEDAIYYNFIPISRLLVLSEKVQISWRRLVAVGVFVHSQTSQLTPSGGVEECIRFNQENFYNYFMGGYLNQLARKNSDPTLFYVRLLNQVEYRPYLFGAIKQALANYLLNYATSEYPKNPNFSRSSIFEEQVENSNLLISLALSGAKRIDNLLVELLSELGSIYPKQVGYYLYELLEQSQNRKALPNSTLTILLTSARLLKLEDLLAKALTNSNPLLRTRAINEVFLLWQDKDTHSQAENLINILVEKALDNFELLTTSLNMLATIFFSSKSQNSAVIGQLHGYARKIIENLYKSPLSRESVARELEKHFPSKGRFLFKLRPIPGIPNLITSLVRKNQIETYQTAILNWLKGIPTFYNQFLLEDLQLFFEILEHNAKAEQVFERLVMYMTCSEQTVLDEKALEAREKDYLFALQNMPDRITRTVVNFALISQLTYYPKKTLPFLQKFYKKIIESEPNFYPAVVLDALSTYLIYCCTNPSNKAALESEDEIASYAIEAINQAHIYHTTYPEVTGLRFKYIGAKVIYLDVIFLYCHLRAKPLPWQWLRDKIQEALECNDEDFFVGFFQGILRFLAFDNGQLELALAVLKELLKIPLVQNKLNLEQMEAKHDTIAQVIQHELEWFLTRLNSVQPLLVKTFLADSSTFFPNLQQRVKVAQGMSDSLGDNVGMTLLLYVQYQITLGNKFLRNGQQHLMLSIIKYKSFEAWIKYLVEYVIEVIYGENITGAAKSFFQFQR